MSDAPRSRTAIREQQLRDAQAVVLDMQRDAAPEPPLLLHLVEAVALDDLPLLLQITGQLARSDEHWPRLIDAICARASQRLPAASSALLDRVFRVAPAALFSFLDESLVHDAVRALTPDREPIAGVPRAQRLCRLAARHQGHANGLLLDLASAALLDVAADGALSASGWFLRIASEAERASIVLAWSHAEWLDPAAAVALFDAATTREHGALAGGLLRWLQQSGAGRRNRVCAAASVVPLLHGEHRQATLHWLIESLDNDKLDVPAWWRAQICSWLRGNGLACNASRAALPAVWFELVDSFTTLPPDAGFADVARALPGAAAWTALDDYPGLSEQQARELLSGIAHRLDPRREEPAGTGAVQPADPHAPSPAAPPPQRAPAPPPRARGPHRTAAKPGIGSAIGSALGGLFGGIIDVLSRREKSGRGPAAEGSDTMRGGPDTIGRPQPAERQLQADVYLAPASGVDAPCRAFVAGRSHWVCISVGRGASVQTGMAFLQPAYEPTQASVPLDVRLIHDDKVTGGSIELPRDDRDNSDAWRAMLEVAPDAQRVEAIVVVLHNGRVLQAARLSGPVHDEPGVTAGPEGIELNVIADVHQFAYLDSRAPFDASVVSSDGSGAAFAGDSFRVQDLRGVEPTVNKIMDRLFRGTEAIAMAGEDGDAERQRSLLVYLAAHGKALHGALIKPRLGALDDARRIQVVNLGQSPVLPLELVYSGPSPTHDATLCDGWRDALASGRCANCTPAAPGVRVAQICPLGFWALSKVIERHAPGAPHADGYDYRLDTCIPGERDRLAPLRSALFAASENVPQKRVEDTLAALRRLEPGCEEARTWADWAEIVQRKGPTLLVSMPHNALDPMLEIPTLEIGRGSDLRAGEVGREYVCRQGADAGPIVLLLGCQTAQGGPLPYHSFVSEFRGSGAAVVIGTLATVLGEHAAPIVQLILTELARPQEPGERTLGDVLLRMRRQMFSRGMLIALAVAAFGDADWSLPATGEDP